MELDENEYLCFTKELDSESGMRFNFIYANATFQNRKCQKKPNSPHQPHNINMLTY